MKNIKKQFGLYLRKNIEGFSMIELLITISFIATMIVLVFAISVSNNKLRYINEEKTKALFYTIESMEAVRLLDWSTLAAGDYSINLVANKWVASSGGQLLDNFYTRTITVSDVYRENYTNGQAYGDIVLSGGYIDVDTKKITINVSWNSKSGNAQQENMETYLHRWQASRWLQTDWVGGDGQVNWFDETKFFSKNAGVDVSTAGVVSLQLGYIDWSNTTTTDNYDTPSNFDDNDVLEKDGIAYLITENNPSGDELYILDVSDPYNVFKISSLDIGSSVNSIRVSGDYAYLATGDNVAELQIININNLSSPYIFNSYDLPSNDDSLDLAISGTEAYIVQGADFYSLSILDPSNIQLLDSLNIAAELDQLFFSDSYVYLATLDSSAEFQIVNVTNPADLNIIGIYDLPGSLKGTDVFVRGNKGYISTQNNGGGPEFFVLDVNEPANPNFLGSYEVNETVHSFSLVGPYALLGTNFLDEELNVLNITDPSNIFKEFGFDLEGYVLGMSANCSMIYAATSSNIGEFFIISTEITDCDYSTAGILESSTFDAGTATSSYNWISWEGNEPLDTDIRFQIATSDNSGGPWDFKGPDGTSTSYYTEANGEYINYTNHAFDKYIRYKLFLDSQADLQTPTLEEVIISYSENL
ncbi:MAG: hypothetical protein WCS88_01190 [Patescibacteria group bacterium]|jgi:hypothetical protein